MLRSENLSTYSGILTQSDVDMTYVQGVRKILPDSKVMENVLTLVVIAIIS